MQKVRGDGCFPKKGTPVGFKVYFGMSLIKVRHEFYNHSGLNFSHSPMDFIYRGMICIMQLIVNGDSYSS